MAARERSEQLSFQIAHAEPAGLPVKMKPMLPLTGDAPFDDPDWFFEPWWPGASVLLYLDSGRLRLQTEHLADPLTAFPELATVGRQFQGDGLMVEGALLVLDDEGRPDGELLRRRLAAADTGPATQRDPRANEGRAAIVASDLLYERGHSITALPFEERRARLSRQLTDGQLCVISRGLRGEGLTLADALSSMGLHEISARELDASYRAGQQDGRWLRLPVAVAPATQTRPLLAVLQRLPL